ncbi:MAG: 50S ribosomal protein L10 [Chitinivibrionales bacterium]|nr:50S ribosomal protein L10 [Chitinivibrionales bacterium]
MLNKEQKVQVVEEFVGVFKEPGFYLMDFKGLNVEEITQLRDKLREANVSMKVVKNTLAKRALAEVGLTGIDEFFVGPTGIVWSSEDSVTPVKVLLDFLKDHDKGTVKAGMVDGILVKDADLERLSKMPSKQELYAQVASALNSPMVKFAQTLNAVPTKFVRTVDAVRAKREEEDAA